MNMAKTGFLVAFLALPLGAVFLMSSADFQPWAVVVGAVLIVAYLGAGLVIARDYRSRRK